MFVQRVSANWLAYFPMKSQFFFCLCACFITVTASGQVPNAPANPVIPAPASSSPAATPVLRFGRTDMQLFELISVCSGPNLDYSVGDEEYKQLQLAAQHRLALIQSEPDLAAILVDHVDRMIDGSSTMPSSLTGIFRALALRPDVDLEAVRRYALLASDLQDQADQYKTKPVPPEKITLMGSIHYGLPDLLGAHPTREGEDYLIKILKHAVVPFEFSLTYKLPAVRAAAKSGTARCLPGLEQTLSEYESAHEAQMKLGNNGLSEDTNEVREGLKKLRERLANQKSGDQPKAAGDFRKINSNAPTNSSDLGINARIGNAADWAALNEVSVPKKWLEQQSDYVRDAVSKKQFLMSKEGVMGVIDASGRFVTWPGAPSKLVRF